MNIFEMMTKYPEIAPFIQHGFEPLKSSDTQHIGDCPFCNKAMKFFINKTTHAWDCKVCGKKGGFLTFLMEMATHCAGNISEAHIVKLQKNRGISIDTFQRFKVGFNDLTGGYTIPIYGATGQAIIDLRTYSNSRLIGTKTCKTGLWNAQGISHSSGTVWLCEGEWDGMVMAEVLTRAGLPDDVAVAVPGASTFKPYWAAAFKDRDVKCLYDHDKAGKEGSIRAFNMLSGCTKSLTFLDWDTEKADGYDIRDLYNNTKNSDVAVLKYINANLIKEPVGAKNKTDDVRGKTQDEVNALEPLTGVGCDAQEVYDVFQKHLYLPDTDVLDVLFGTFIANRLEGDPVWLFLVAPSGMSKSELLQSFSTCKRTLATTTMTPHTLISGFSLQGGGDPSLIPKLDQKVLVMKDFTAIFNMNQQAREEIFGILRDAYDGETTKRFANGIIRQYKSRFGIVAGVTPIIESYLEGESALGERFLRYQLLLPVSIETLMPYLDKASGNTTHENAMREEFKEVCNRCLDHTFVDNVVITPEMNRRILYLAAYGSQLRGTVMRDKYTREITGRPYIEMGTRFAKELLKMLRGICMFRGVIEPTEHEFRILSHVTKSTISKQNYFVELIWSKFQDGEFSIKELCTIVRLPNSAVARQIETLTLLDILEKTGQNGMTANYTFTKEIKHLIDKSGIYSS